MQFHLPHIRLSFGTRIELERIVRRTPDGERFDRVLAEQMRGAPQAIEHLNIAPASKHRTSAERVAEHRARKRVQASSTHPKEK